MTDFSGIGFKYTPPGGGAAAGSLWYAPDGLAAAPATIPVASGGNALAAGNAAVASAQYGIALGNGATASTQDSIAIGRAAVASTRSGAIAIGVTATANDESNIAIGTSAGASSYMASIAIGYSATASAASAVALGSLATASIAASVALGSDGRTYNSYEVGRRDGYLGGRDLTPMLSAVTTDGALTNLRNNTRGILIPNNSAAGFRGICSAWRAAGAGIVGDSATWMIDGLISNVGGVYTLIGAAVGVAGAPNYNDAGAAGWTLAAAIVANQLRLQATGQAGETIYWEATLQLVTTA